jgi:hypothetical protein
MKLYTFSVMDLKAETFMPPFFMHNEKLAERAFGDAANEGEHMFSKHPEDYALYCIGTWDDDTGQFENYQTPKSLGIAAQYINKPKQEVNDVKN